jgi:hypothetical protein
MAVGNSGRIVIEVDPAFKQTLYAQLDQEGLTLKDWFVLQASQYVEQNGHLPLFANTKLNKQEKKK